MANILRAASTWLKIALGCFSLGLILFVIGFATSSWMVSSNYRNQHMESGLWQHKFCAGSTCQGGDTYPNDYHRAIQAMECLGLIGFFLALLVLLLYICADSCRRKDFLQATVALAFAGVLFSSIGYAIFGSSTNNENLYGRGRNIGWSMGVAIAGTIFYALGGIMLIVQLIK
ncbi:uncharacterized protein LOC131936934 [Physella acuta]|uniref:uncharacterized protein LOC131936934 n=1 Tax=Physella acuta TaxID=109671 RepID=UPI0027DB73F9|nr:uncharacterized protein LOC131936934 [Physella acuta]